MPAKKKSKNWRAPIPAPRQWIPGEDEERKLDSISSVEWPEHYPPLNNRRANLLWRAREVKLCADNPRRRALHKTLCKRDMLYWFAGWCWIYETRSAGAEIGSILPLLPYDFQLDIGRELEQSIDRQHDLAIPKSRDMGLTWITLLTLQHRWLFGDGFTALLASKKQDLVDKLGNPNTLFEKLRFNLRKQPRWLLPLRFDWREHDKFLLLINPERNCSIEGSTTTGDTGRSGRFNVALIDEHAAISRGDAMKMEAALSDAAASRWYLSTPRGDQNLFFKKCHSEQTKRLDVHWTRHPHKGYQAYCEVKFSADGKVTQGTPRSPWYDFEVIKRDQPGWMIAQELDISFSGSIETLVDPYVLRSWRESAPEPIETRYKQHRHDGEPALLIWEHAEKGQRYIVMSDPSGGTMTGSHTGAHVFRLPGWVHVAEYQGRIGIDILSTLLYVLGREYNWAYIACEANTGVEALNNLLKGHIDRNGLAGDAEARIKAYPKQRIILHTKPDGMKTDKPGIWTSEQTKRFMVFSLLEPAVRNRDMIIRGRRTLSELAGFHEDGTKICNPEGDDLVMALNVGLYGERFLHKGQLSQPTPFLGS